MAHAPVWQRIDCAAFVPVSAEHGYEDFNNHRAFAGFGSTAIADYSTVALHRGAIFFSLASIACETAKAKPP